ncbi:MAG: mannose-6-phosphate isomerase, class I, partial [Anaerolineae bacterium]|nr:mannose-6-phosphate isomerase, class I [Anaerolineae bacterium]
MKPIAFEARPCRLRNTIQHYDWGARDKEAFIAHFLGMQPEPGVPYAELWMGTHPKAPSVIQVDDTTTVSLRDFIAQHPQETLGDAVAGAFEGTLPFLFKVLSTQEALSIQTHPSKEQARVLHARDPENYPDANHKPEIAIALDGLTALMGFKNFAATLATLETYPEIADFIATAFPNGATPLRALRAVERADKITQQAITQQVYQTLIERSARDATALNRALNQLHTRLSSMNALTEEERLFIELRHQYTGADVGLFLLFLLNLIHLKQGEAVFTLPGIPHAYLKGNIIECMANSDNVARAGLTPKFKDAPTLLEILDYEAQPRFIIPERVNETEVVYHTPVPEFEILHWRLDAQRPHAIPAHTGPAILLITQG